jgi:hypothetical protein
VKAPRGAPRAVPLALALALGLVAAAGTGLVWRLAAPLVGGSAPARAVGSAELRAALARSGLLALQPPAAAEIAAAAADGECPEYRVAGRPLAPAELPATLAAPWPARAEDAVLVSLWLDPCRLDRLHADPGRRGRASEELGWVSVFEGGELRFASAVGVRLHGGAARKHPPFSYRLYFRGEHGVPGLPAPLLSPELDAPVARVYLDESLDFDRDGRRWYFPGEVAYEIGRRLGAWTPRTRPVRFSLNGAAPTLYVLGEHLGADYFARHFGHRDFELVRGKREAGDPTEAIWRRELDWLAAAPRPLTAERAARRYDLDRLTTWLTTVLFCATGDLYQDAMIRDRTGRLAGGRWTWIHWDHDMSFRSPRGSTRFGRLKDLLPYLLWSGKPADVAPARELARRLILEDPAFRRRLAERIVRALNHELTPGFLDALVDRQARLARELGAEDVVFADRLRAYFAARPAQLLAQVEEVLGFGPAAEVEVVGPAAALRVDGHPIAAGYRGRYSVGLAVRVEVEPEQAARLRGWRVNGSEVAGRPARLELAVDGPLRIEALLDERRAGLGSPVRD